MGPAPVRAELVSAHLHLVRPIVLRLTGRLDGEVVARGYFELVLAAAEFDAARGVPFEAFARERVRNRLISWLRYENRRTHGAIEEDAAAPAVPERDAALRIDIQRAIDRLPAAERLALHLRFWKGLNLAEAARESGCRAHAAKAARGRAIATLRAELGK